MANNKGEATYTTAAQEQRVQRVTEVSPELTESERREAIAWAIQGGKQYFDMDAEECGQ